MRLALAVVLPVLAAGACSGAGDVAADTTEGEGASRPDRPAAPATNEDIAFPQAEAAVMEARAMAERLYLDPSVLEGPDSSELQQLRELHTPDSPIVDGIVDSLLEYADSGHSLQPASHGFYQRIGLHDPFAIDADTVTFGICRALDFQEIDAAGEMVEESAWVSIGQVEVHRVDGAWRLHTIRDLGDPVHQEPGFAAESDCSRDQYQTYSNILGLPVAPGEETAQ